MHECPSFREYARQTSVGILVTDREGRVTWCNPAFSALCGHTSDELAGRMPESVLYGERTSPPTVRRIAAAIAERRPFDETLVHYRKDGHPYWVAVHGSPIVEEERGIDGHVVHVRRLADLPAALPRDDEAAVIAWPALVPLCAQCKKVRDDEGTWRRVETFLQSLGQEQLTHGLCRDCIDEWT